MKKSLRRKRRSAKKLAYVPVDPSGDAIHVLSFFSPKPLNPRSHSPEEVRRYQAPLNSHNEGFHLLR
jgi:hypothetical protein